MSTNPTLEAELQALDRKWEQITDVPESPRSVMDVIEYSLGSQRKAEVYVNRLLHYLLNPEEPHGMGVEFLRALLEGLPDAADFTEDTHDLSSVVVDEQVRVKQFEDGEAVSTGILDLLVEVPGEWFLMIELKFGAEDTQTEFYYDDETHVEDTQKTAYESGEYYVYLRPADRPAANEPAFTNWTWEAFREDVLQPFILERAPRYPQRTVAQLHELADDIADLTGMTEHQRNEQEKIALYLDHYDAIHDVTETFDDAWATFTDEWASSLGEALAEANLGTTAAPEEYVTQFTLRRDGRGEPWNFRASSSDWGMLFKDGWWRHTDDLDGSLRGRADDRNDVRIGFHHRLENDRQTALGENTLTVYFRNMGANDQPFIDDFSDRFDEHATEIEGHLPDGGNLTGNKRDKFVVQYDIEVDDHDDFFEAYVAALQTAYIELVAENEALISTLDDLFLRSLSEVYDFDPGF